MRITVFSIGLRGDVQPCIALARGLAQAGHRVCVATHARYEHVVRTYGLDFAPVAGDTVQDAEDRRTGKQAAVTASFSEQFEHYARLWIEGALAASDEAELLIFGQLAFVGMFVAEKLRIPCCAAYLVPATTTGSFPSVFVPLRSLGGPLNRLSHVIEQQAFWQPLRGALNRVRQDALDLPPLPFSGYHPRMDRERIPMLYGFSPMLVKPPADWGDWIRVTGYWFLDNHDDYAPPAELERFLQAGAPPVYIGFGSVTAELAAARGAAISEALKQTGLRAVIEPSEGAIALPEGAEHVYLLKDVPHRWLFPRVAAVVHHGGTGITAAGLRAGRPTAIFPVFGEANFWGRRVAALGAGPAPVPFQRFSVASLAGTLRTLTGDAAVKARAATLGAAFSREDGVASAVELLSTGFARGQMSFLYNSAARS